MLPKYRRKPGHGWALLTETAQTSERALAGFFGQMPGADGYALRNSETHQKDDSQHYCDAHGYAASEIKQDALNIHRASVNLTIGIRNVTLVSSVVRVELTGCALEW